MRYQVLDTVVLAIDLPEHGLRAGDIGAVVEQYDDEGVEVEFVTGAGTTQALLGLPLDHVRPITATDIPAVRTLGRASLA
jgi:hypothetical protein